MSLTSFLTNSGRLAQGYLNTIQNDLHPAPTKEVNSVVIVLWYGQLHVGARNPSYTVIGPSLSELSFTTPANQEWVYRETKPLPLESGLR